MSDTYFVDKIKCAYCDKENNFMGTDEISGELGLPWQFEFGAEFVCKYCKKNNKVEQNFKAVKTKK